MTVEHECCRSEACTEEGYRVMTHHNMPAAVLYFLQVRYLLKHLLRGCRELLRVVISSNEHLVAGKRADIERPLALLSPDEITENIYGVIRSDSRVPVFDYLIVHLRNVRKRALVELNHIRVPDMQVGYIVNCQFVTSFHYLYNQFIHILRGLALTQEFVSEAQKSVFC